MSEDEFGRGVQMGTVLNAIDNLKTDLATMSEKVDDMQRTLSSLTGGHRALLWVFSALGVAAGFLGSLYSGVFAKGHH